MPVSAYDASQIPIRYQALNSLIEHRQAQEKLHPEKPEYQRYPTTYDFTDRHGDNLLHLAVLLGDLDKVRQCMEVYDIDSGSSNNADLPL